MKDNLILLFPALALAMACVAMSFVNRSLAGRLDALEARVQALESGSQELRAELDKFDKTVQKLEETK